MTILMIIDVENLTDSPFLNYNFILQYVSVIIIVGTVIIMVISFHRTRIEL